jgi:uncharacterized membrane protein
MCLVVVVGVAFPRIALLLAWLFTHRVDRAFDGIALPLLGLIFLPYTTLFYVLAYAPRAHVETIGWVFVAFGVLLDLSSHSRAGRWRAQRRY